MMILPSLRQLESSLHVASRTSQGDATCDLRHEDGCVFKNPVIDVE